MPKPPRPPSKLALTPKQSFLADAKRASAHSDWMASPEFRAAAAAALLQYQLRIIPTGESANFAATSLRLSGAQGFLDVLMNLGLPDAPAAVVSDSQLTPPEAFGGWSRATDSPAD